MPLVHQYSTRPDGKKAIMTPKTSGIAVIIFFCIGSMPGVGVIFWVRYITARLIAGRMKYGSGAVRFWIQPIHGAWRISTDSRSIQYSAMNTGMVTRIGRQPPIGLIFSFL